MCWVWSNLPNYLILDPTHGLRNKFQNLVQMEIRQEDVRFIDMFIIVQYNQACFRTLIRVDLALLDSDRIRNADQDLVAMKLIYI